MMGLGFGFFSVFGLAEIRWTLSNSILSTSHAREGQQKTRQEFVWPSENRESGASDHKKKQQKPYGIRARRFSPSPRVQNILRPLKIRALTCVAKDATSTCLAEQIPEVWGK